MGNVARRGVVIRCWETPVAFPTYAIGKIPHGAISTETATTRTAPAITHDRLRRNSLFFLRPTLLIWHFDLRRAQK
jgi:hypothetical protein